MFKIKIYLHGSTETDILVAILNKNKFEVIRSTKIGMTNKPDDEHLRSAFVYNAIVLTAKVDFPKPQLNLRHKGVLIVHEPITINKILAALKEIRRQIEEHGVSLEGRILPLEVF